MSVSQLTLTVLFIWFCFVPNWLVVAKLTAEMTSFVMSIFVLPVSVFCNPVAEMTSFVMSIFVLPVSVFCNPVAEIIPPVMSIFVLPVKSQDISPVVLMLIFVVGVNLSCLSLIKVETLLPFNNIEFVFNALNVQVPFSSILLNSLLNIFSFVGFLFFKELVYRMSIPTTTNIPSSLDQHPP